MLTDEDRDNLAGCRVVASVSGGKDSTALSLWLTEQGIEHDRVFADTGWEHPSLYEYIRGPLAEKIGPIDWVRGDRQMEDLIRHKGMFPSSYRRYCTTELKVKPIAKYVKNHPRCGELVMAVGVRAEESDKRAKMPRWEEETRTFEASYWRPLLDWTEQDVIDIHKRNNLAPSRLYLELNAQRVGCWPCINSRKSEIKAVAEDTPERIEKLIELEKLVKERTIQRAEARGGFENDKGIPSFFRATVPGKNGDYASVGEVVEWSKTSRGGRQLLMFDTEPAGCVRWGMCEVQKDEDS